jgi:hypothetical protein
MHRQREDRIVIGKYRRRTITLMHVKVYDGDARNAPLGLHQSCRDGRIIEYTKSLPKVGVCVVRTTR